MGAVAARFHALPRLLPGDCRGPFFIPGTPGIPAALVSRLPLSYTLFLSLGETSFMKHAAWLRITISVLGLLALAPSALAQADAAKKLTWHPLEFAIVRFNEAAPNSWNIYHSEKKGVLLVRLWKRYLLVNVSDEEVYDIDPQKIKISGDSVEWSYADIPDK